MSATRAPANVIFLSLENSNHKPKKALVALSGGVDSAVAAALLEKQGFEVVGVFFDLGSWGKMGLNNAKKIAKVLGISLKIVDARKEFKKKIIDYFVSSYGKGVTPNPCVVCNKEMKFDLLFGLLKEYKADFAATGHYARVKVRPFPPPHRRIPQGQTFYELREAKDKTKDQSYFLYRLTQKELAKTIFPLGEYKKTDVKKLAKKLGLPVAEEESQDVCFLLGTDINSFLKKYLKPKAGDIVDEKGNILGRHKGLPFYTIGQRKGIEIGGAGPYFVIGKNSRNNELIVSNDPKRLLTKKFDVSQANWINKGVRLPLQAEIQLRYHSSKISARIKSGKSGKLHIESKKYFRAVTPGQSAVFYKNGEVQGGGIVTS